MKVNLTSFKRDTWLDFLRFQAILLVLVAHMNETPQYLNPILGNIINFIKQGGWVGVDLFFVLSGYLVSGLLFSEIKKNNYANVPRFLIRRGFKIYPSFYLSLLFTLIWHLVYIDDSLSRKKLIGEVFFIQNYVGFYWPHHWSLAVEEHFYVSLAVAIYFVLKFNDNHIRLDAFRSLPLIWVTVALVCFLFRFQASYNLPFDGRTQLMPTHLRIDSLLTGALLAWLMHYRYPNFRPNTTKRLIIALSGLSLFLPAFFWDFTKVWWILPFGAFFNAVGGAMLILAGFARIKSGGFIESRLAWIGMKSYNIYLWHLPWLVWLNPALCRRLEIQENWGLCTTSYLVGSILLGAIMTSVVEKPFLHLRDKFFPSSAVPLPVAA